MRQKDLMIFPLFIPLLKIYTLQGAGAVLFVQLSPFKRV